MFHKKHSSLICIFLKEKNMTQLKVFEPCYSGKHKEMWSWMLKPKGKAFQNKYSSTRNLFYSYESLPQIFVLNILLWSATRRAFDILYKLFLFNNLLQLNTFLPSLKFSPFNVKPSHWSCYNLRRHPDAITFFLVKPGEARRYKRKAMQVHDTRIKRKRTESKEGGE